MTETSIRPATLVDIPQMVALSAEKRRNYERVQPVFWRHGAGADKTQAQWFTELLGRDDHTLLVAESQGKTLGFIIGQVVKAPMVYDPGGLTLMIDDFCVSQPEMWTSVGGGLVAELKRLARRKGAVQVVVVCGAHDEPKRQFLKSVSLTIASEWYVGEV